MRVEEVTMALFAACNLIRLIAYIPQIYTAATDKNGASAISHTTWGLFFIAHLSTIAYAIVNQSDWWLAACFTCNALCCLAILLLAFFKKAAYLRAQDPSEWLSSGRQARLSTSLKLPLRSTLRIESRAQHHLASSRRSR
jgi:uncharacterized protein with PQ loop repeat